ncbi:GntT/GntP/DsdX family permease [Aeromonas rivuli]|uniref:GntT/GntP/DsdX family permease n=1 Tax=Aeromonas rivuli TaxID=648794 RepID=UPI0021E237FC|nr:hypothetical protein [Aeromonas rivuli]
MQVAEHGHQHVQLGHAVGSIVLSHVNDSGFWLANRYLGLSEKQTLQTWTVMETIIGTTGGVVAMIIFSLL